MIALNTATQTPTSASTLYGYPDLHTFTLCQDDWELVLVALRSVVAHHMSEMYKVGDLTPVGESHYDEAQKYRAVADYIDFYLPETNDK